jgi:hypothetical protein
MRASVTAARLKSRMRAICYFGPAPVEDRMSAFGAREPLASARQSAAEEDRSVAP